MTTSESQAIHALYTTISKRLAANPGMSLDELREMMETWTTLATEPEQVTYRPVDAGGVPALWCLPAGHAADRAILYIHGGAYVGGSIDSHRKMVGHLAAASRCPALIIDYRRAPEHPPPAQLQDCVTAYRWLSEQGLEGRRIVVAGDSAGGALATGLVLQARDADTPLPAGIVAISPWYDLEANGETFESNANLDALVGREPLRMLGQIFLAGTSPTDPNVSPLHADLNGLPPTYLVVGSHETLLDDARRFTEKARSAGVDVTLVAVPEMQHVFTFMAGRAPEADGAINAIAKWARNRLDLD